MSYNLTKNVDDIEMKRQAEHLKNLQRIAYDETPRKCWTCGYNNHPREQYCGLCNTEQNHAK